MGGRNNFFPFILMLLAGFAGGIFSNIFILQGAQATNNIQKEVTAQAFNLVDENGKHRGGLTFSKDGCPVVGFVDESGRVPAYFGLGPGGPMIAFQDKKNNMRFSIGLDKEGNPDLFFYDDKKKPKIGMVVDKKSDPGIILYDHDNVARMMMMVQNKSPRIGFVEGMKSVDFLLTTRPDGQGGMVMQNKHGQIILGMYNDAPVLMLKKGDKTESMSGFTPAGEPFFALRKDGKTAWVAPPGKKAEIESIDPAADWQRITDTLLKQPKF